MIATSYNKDKKATNQICRKLAFNKAFRYTGAFCLLFGFGGFCFLAIYYSTSPQPKISTNDTSDETYEKPQFRIFREPEIYNESVWGRPEYDGIYNESLWANYDETTCTYALEDGACVVTCRNLNEPEKIVGPYIENTTDSLACTSVHVKIISSNYPDRTLSKGWLMYQGRKRITKLWIANCNINVIEDDAFEGMEDLEKLYLESLSISELRSRVIENMRGLKELYLNNQYNLKYIEAQILSNFANFDTLQMLYFTNLDSVLPNITGETMRSISIVDFRYNDIPTLKSHFFQGLGKCQQLHFKGSGIKYIEPKTFYFPSTTSFSVMIDLSENDLETLSEDAINLDHFSSINLRNNTWRCDCSLVWLAEKMLDSNYLGKFTGDVICAQPDELKGKKLTESGIIDSCSGSTSSTTSSPTDAAPTTTQTTTESSTVPTSTTTDEVPPTTDSSTISTSTTTDEPPSPTEASSSSPQEETTTSFTDTTTTTTVRPAINITASSPDCPRHGNIVSNEQQTNKYSVEETEVGTVTVEIPGHENGWSLYLRGQDNDPCWYSTAEAASVAFEIKLSEGQQYFFCMLPEGNTPNYNDCQMRTMQVQEINRPWMLNNAKTPIFAAAGVVLAILSIVTVVAIRTWLYHVPTRFKTVPVRRGSSLKILIISKSVFQNSVTLPRYRSVSECA